MLYRPTDEAVEYSRTNEARDAGPDGERARLGRRGVAAARPGW